MVQFIGIQSLPQTRIFPSLYLVNLREKNLCCFKLGLLVLKNSQFEISKVTDTRLQRLCFRTSEFVAKTQFPCIISRYHEKKTHKINLQCPSPFKKKVSEISLLFQVTLYTMSGILDSQQLLFILYLINISSSFVQPEKFIISTISSYVFASEVRKS